MNAERGLPRWLLGNSRESAAGQAPLYKSR